jgi:lysophospholipase L1-like esterase
MIVDTKKLTKKAEGFTNSADVTGGCQYIRWMSNGRREKGPALMVIAIGVNSIAISRDVDLRLEDAIKILETEAEVIIQLLKELSDHKESNGFTRRPKR